MDAAAAADQSPIAQTSAGRVRGYARDGVSIFKGIPYAAPTGGKNRFMAPAPREPWDGVREAVDYGQRCPQVDGPVLVEEGMSLPYEAMGEDCLVLNVWTPAVGDGGRRPVMVWLHGGGFAVGSGAGARYDGVNLCSRRDVVVVTVNHRLNALGFLHLGALDPRFADAGNAGMLDCVAALEWVRDNIASFGGDPANVTVFGESGGGMKATTLMAMPSARGLFHRAIVQSGPYLRAAEPAEAQAAAEDLLKQLGIAAQDVAPLQDVPLERILAVVGTLPLFAFQPVADGRVLPGHPFDPAAPALSRGMPMLIGTNETETTFLPMIPLDPIPPEALTAGVAGFTQLPAAEVERLIGLYRREYPDRSDTYLLQLITSDWWMVDASLVQAERKAAQGGAPAYVYAFDQHTPVREGRLNCPHSLEIGYAFDNLELSVGMAGPITAQTQSLAEAMSEAWTSFARTGAPQATGLPPWPAYDAVRRSVMTLGTRCAVDLDPHAVLREAVRALKSRA